MPETKTGRVAWWRATVDSVITFQFHNLADPKVLEGPVYRLKSEGPAWGVLSHAMLIGQTVCLTVEGTEVLAVGMSRLPGISVPDDQ